MPNSLTWCDLPNDVSLWPGLPLSLSGDEVMPLDYHAGRSGWLLYGRNLDKSRLTDYQHKLGAAMVIVTAWCVEDYQVIRLAGSLTPRATRLAHEDGLDVAPLGKIPHLKSPGLLVMDMDSTAIQIECIDEIAKLAGTGELVSEVTERAMRGELDFTASLRLRVGTLEADYLRDKLHLTATVANELEIRDGKLTGQVIGQIVDAQFKAQTLKNLAEKYDVPIAQCVAIGDGANDLPMIQAAGLGIAYHAKPKVNEKTEVTIRHADLMGVFCILSGSLNQK